MKIDGKDWKLVPVERTTDMHDAQHLAYGEPCNQVWRAQIAAAPQPDIEALVEGVTNLLAECYHVDMPTDDISRAVLRHLFGEG
jgi:hypothetical protein